MSDQDPPPTEETAPLAAQHGPAEQTPAQQEPDPATTGATAGVTAGAKGRWRDRSWGLPAVVAVALVAVLLGGLGGAALASVGDHQGLRRGPGFGRGGGPGMPPGGMPGQRRQWRFEDPHGFGQRQWNQQRPGQVQPLRPGQQQPTPARPSRSPDQP